MTVSLVCPVSRCGAANEPGASRCVRCELPLDGYGRLVAHPADLFNQGLAAARAGRLRTARDLFSAVVRWCPLDLDARNAFALACFELGDEEEARRSWDEVLARSPHDETARRGLAELDRGTRPGRAAATRPAGTAGTAKPRAPVKTRAPARKRPKTKAARARQRKRR